MQFCVCVVEQNKPENAANQPARTDLQHSHLCVVLEALISQEPFSMSVLKLLQGQ